jgi:hypothetical protein
MLMKMKMKIILYEFMLDPADLNLESDNYKFLHKALMKMNGDDLSNAKNTAKMSM